LITLQDLLADKQFREYFTTKPIMPGPVHQDAMPWRVYVQRQLDGGWAKKEFHTYIEAFRFLKPRLKGVHDAAIQSKGIAWSPPHKVVRITRGGKPVKDDKGKPVLRRIVWQPSLPPGEEPHTWCTYCRRPTVFRWYSRHHAFPRGYEFTTPYQRCTICGASERLVLNSA
jgi:hypothetical protein